MTNDMYRRLCDKRKRAQRRLDKRTKVCYTVTINRKELAR